jgi:hypothetical protein
MRDVSIDNLIDSLTDDLKPVQPRRMARGSLWAGLGWAVGAVGVAYFIGVRHDLENGNMAPVPLLSFWLFAGVTIAAGWSAVRMGMPGVGRDYSGWRWAGLVTLALPLSATALFMGDSHVGMEAANMEAGTFCMTEGIIAGLGVGSALFWWLRSGAPTSPTRAGLVIGIAAGAAGATIVSLQCQADNIIHISLWHGLSVGASGVMGRLILPQFLRW